MAQKESVSKLLRALESFSSTKKFSRCLKQIKCRKLEGGACTLYLKVEQEHTNVFGTLHGGLAATITDTISFFALESHPQFLASSRPPFYSGVTSNLHITYLNPVKSGEGVFFKAKTLDIRKHLASIEISVSNSDSSKIYAKGSVNISLIS